MKIISFNIWDLPFWFIKDRRDRIVRIVQYLISTSSDIICLQECWSLNHRLYITEQFKKSGYTYTAIHGKQKNGGVMTFSKFPIVSARFIPFGRRALSFSEMIGNKGVLETLLETPFGSIKVYNLHLHHQANNFLKTTYIRLRQLRLLFNTISKEDQTPSILAGDFNQHDMFENEKFKNIFSQQRFIHYDVLSLPTYRLENLFAQHWVNRIKYSQQLDYILVKNMDTLHLSVSHYKAEYLDVPLSDHDPIILELVASPDHIKDDTHQKRVHNHRTSLAFPLEL